jgi:hypothetical protein
MPRPELEAIASSDTSNIAAGISFEFASTPFLRRQKPESIS